MQTANLALEKTGIMDETVVLVLVVKHTHEPPPPPFYTLEVYDKTPILIPVDITGDVVKLVARKLSGS